MAAITLPDGAGLTGYLANAATETLTTAYVLGDIITLSHGAAMEDAGATRPPSNFAKHPRLLLELSSAGSVSAVDAYFTWDAAGDRLAAGPFSSTDPVAGLTTATDISFGIGLDDWVPVYPAGVTPGTLYLHLKLTGGTGTLDKAYLPWIALDDLL